jgi:hypothetical protein
MGGGSSSSSIGGGGGGGGGGGITNTTTLTSGTHYAQSLVQSMTIEEMRALHKRALQDAEAKQTELRLVLASRYRELVGSSDEVIKMRERAQELHTLVHAIPTLMGKLIHTTTTATTTTTSSSTPSTTTTTSSSSMNNSNNDNKTADAAMDSQTGSEETKSQEENDVATNPTNTVAVVVHKDQDEKGEVEEEDMVRAVATVQELRYKLARLPRTVHRALDTNNVHEATVALMELFRLIADQSDGDEYPLAVTLAKNNSNNNQYHHQHQQQLQQQQHEDEYGPTSTTMTPTPTSTKGTPLNQITLLLQVQVRMTFLHVQTLPIRVVKIAKQILDSSSSISTSTYFGSITDDNNNTTTPTTTTTMRLMDAKYGAQTSASALAALNLLEIHHHHHSNRNNDDDNGDDSTDHNKTNSIVQRQHEKKQQHQQQQRGFHHGENNKPVELLDLYFDSKARLLQSLLSQLNSSSSSSNTTATNTNNPPQQQHEETNKDGTGDTNHSTATTASSTNNAEEILSKIVRILQYDIVLHPYQIFVLRKFPVLQTTLTSTSSLGSNNTTNHDMYVDNIMQSLPIFPGSLVMARTSNFLAAHLPLIRTKVKNVLIDIAGTTASALGKIRQSLYDKTDGIECMEKLDLSTGGICTWEEAVMGVVDVQRVLLSSNSSSTGGGGTTTTTSDTASTYNSSGTAASVTATTSPTIDGGSSTQYQHRKFSLWGVLFSNTFSSLVHSLLTSSFHSVHTKVVSTLRLSLANAPPLSAILPHEAYRNTLHIASELDAALLKVSEDAHELLVHAEEREESERRLRQSLYVQTCEIMGRLICELRRMLLPTESSYHHDDAVKQLIVGRLCHLLKFRLTALPTLLNPNSTPAVLFGTTATGMISLTELSSAFDLADDNDDGLITFQEAMEAVDSAFSGTPFHGAEMVRETLLLPGATSAPSGSGGGGVEKDNNNTRSLLLQASDNMNRAVTPHDVTLNELTLLLARGLRHETSGGRSALGTIQDSLNYMMASCFDKWAKDALLPYTSVLSMNVKAFVEVACTSSESEYQRMHNPSPSSEVVSAVSSTTIPVLGQPVVSNVSPHVTSFLIDVSFTLSRSLCPSDSLLPVPSVEYAVTMGLGGSDIPRMIDIIRWCLLTQALVAVTDVFQEHAGMALQRSERPAMKDSAPSGIVQLKNDVTFLQACFFERNQYGFGGRGSEETAKANLISMINSIDNQARTVCDMDTIRQIESKHEHVQEICYLFLSSLFGEGSSAAAVPVNDLGGSFGAAPRTDSTPLFNGPLASSCRFPLLPIQADRTLSGVQARGKYKDKEEPDSRTETVGSGAVRAGFGFFSSMLKKS